MCVLKEQAYPEADGLDPTGGEVGNGGVPTRCVSMRLKSLAFWMRGKELSCH